MKDFLNGLVNRIKGDPINVIYDIIIFIGSVLVLFGLIYIYLFVRRWYLQARIRRSSHDFEEVAEYIKKQKHSLSRLQQTILEETGQVFNITWKSILGWVLFCIALILVNIFISSYIQAQYINIYKTINMLLIVLNGIIWIIYDIYALKELIVHGRIILFVCCILITTAFCYGFFVIYQYNCH